MSRKYYALTIRIPVSGMDDIDARIRSKEIMSDIKTMIDWSNKKQVKLQEVFENKEPRGIVL